MQPLSVTESTLLSTTRKTRKADDTLVIMRDTVGRQFFLTGDNDGPLCRGFNSQTSAKVHLQSFRDSVTTVSKYTLNSKCPQ